MNDRPPSINEPGQENLDRNILRNEIHVFLSETGWGIFNRNSGEISSGIDIIATGDRTCPEIALGTMIHIRKN